MSFTHLSQRIFLLHHRLATYRAKFWGKYYRYRYTFLFDSVGVNLHLYPPIYLVPFLNFLPNQLSIALGDHVKLGPNLTIQGSGRLHIGSRTTIEANTVIGCNQSISIGPDCLIASGVSIRDTDHQFANRNKPIRLQGITTSPVTIEANVWLGSNVTVTRGITIGTGSVIGANSVVTRDIPPHSIAAGIPTKVIKARPR